VPVFASVTVLAVLFAPSVRSGVEPTPTSYLVEASRPLGEPTW
jgi:hypothetical protein